jgi:extracellular factor (EF) 3-hydroxypalmitic acid methyl ester biosynthesis protein
MGFAATIRLPDVAKLFGGFFSGIGALQIDPVWGRERVVEPTLIVSTEPKEARAIPEIWPARPFPQQAFLADSDDDAVQGQIIRYLDEAADYFDRGQWRDGMQLVDHTTAAARRALSDSFWTDFCKKQCITHPVKDFIHQDPFTRRSFQKPRGYAGDAVLLDYIYGISHHEHDLYDSTPLGRWLYHYTSNTMAPRAVRRRMTVLAELIDRVCIDRRSPRILSIASGHMRELQFSHAVRARAFGEIVAFDQDAASLDHIAPINGSKLVKTIQGSIFRLIVGRHDFDNFDLVYAAGLLDYLDQWAAKRLTTTMFEVLNPGGTLLVANFLDHIDDIGYMESFMGWDLVFRNSSQITPLADDITAGVSLKRYFEESQRNIGFLLVRKAA